MDIDLIRTFIQVAKTSHFRKASEQLFLTPSATSARVKLLEEKIGTILFNRDKHHVSLTPAGTKFISYAETILNTWARAKHDISLPDGIDASLSVGATDTIWNIFLTSWLVQMNRTNSDLALHAELNTTHTLIPNVLDGSLDIAVMFEPPHLPALAFHEIGAVDFILISSGKAMGTHMAMTTDYVNVHWGDTFNTTLKQSDLLTSQAKIHTSVGRVALDYILQAGGTAYLPRPMVNAAIVEGLLYQVVDAPIIPRLVYAAHLVSCEKNELLQTAIHQMKQTFL